MAFLSVLSSTRTSLNIRVEGLTYSSIYSNIYITVNGVRSDNLAQNFNTPYSTSWNFTGLTCGTNYAISFSALVKNAPKAETGSGSRTTDTCPVVSNPPSSMGYIGITTSSSTEGKISATWSSVSGASYYFATVYDSNGSWYGEKTVYGTDVDFSGLPLGRNYYVGVVPWNSDGKGGSNTSSSIYVGSLTPPPSSMGSISIVPSSTTAGRVTASWGSVSGANYYFATLYGGNGNWLAEQTVTGTSVAFNTFEGIYVYIGVVPWNNNGIKGGSNTSATVMMPTMQKTPATISSVTAIASTVDRGKLSVAWSSSERATSYLITVYNSGGGWVNDTATTGLTTTFTGLTEGSRYYVIVVPRNSYGNTTGTQSSTITMPSFVPPPSQVGTITLSPSTITEGVLHVNWGAAARATAYSVTLYRSNGIYVADEAVLFGATTVSFSGLVVGASYYVTIIGADGTTGQLGAAKSSSNVTIPAIPKVPSNMGTVTATASTVTAGKISAGWAAVSGATYYFATLYKADGSWLAEMEVTGREATFTGAPEGIYVYVGVVPWNSAGKGGSNKSSNVLMPTFQKTPDAMGAVYVTPSSTTAGRVTATWFGVARAEYYVATVYTAAGAYLDSKSINETNVAFSDITEGVYVYVGIVPWNTHGKGISGKSENVLMPTINKRPANWAWYNAKDKGQETTLTSAAEWNSFQDRINEFRMYKKETKITFVRVVSGKPMLATQINAVASAIRGMIPPLAPFANVSSGEYAEAKVLNRLRDSLNSIN